MDYNYSRFNIKDYDLESYPGLQLNDVISDQKVNSVNGQQHNLSDFFNKPVVIETGSYTCGMFAAQRNQMNKLAVKYDSINFLILYVREAHPGKRINNHSNQQEKDELAAMMVKHDGVKNRTVIVDDFTGTLHKQLGLLPNMVFLFDKNRKVVYRNNWSEAKELEKAIKKHINTQDVVPYKWKMLPPPNIKEEYKVFKRAGWNAFIDFLIELPKVIVMHLQTR